jgi:hypothetical protein
MLCNLGGDAYLEESRVMCQRRTYNSFDTLEGVTPTFFAHHFLCVLCTVPLWPSQIGGDWVIQSSHFALGHKIQLHDLKILYLWHASL